MLPDFKWHRSVDTKALIRGVLGKKRLPHSPQGRVGFPAFHWAMNGSTRRSASDSSAAPVQRLNSRLSN